MLYKSLGNGLDDFYRYNFQNFHFYSLNLEVGTLLRRIILLTVMFNRFILLLFIRCHYVIYRDFFELRKLKNFLRKNLIFFLFLLKTLIVGTR